MALRDRGGRLRYRILFSLPDASQHTCRSRLRDLVGSGNFPYHDYWLDCISAETRFARDSGNSINRLRSDCFERVFQGRRSPLTTRIIAKGFWLGTLLRRSSQ